MERDSQTHFQLATSEPHMHSILSEKHTKSSALPPNLQALVYIEEDTRARPVNHGAKMHHRA